MEDNNKIHNRDKGAEKVIDSGAEKPIDNRTELTINDQDQPEITLKYLMTLARNGTVAQNERDMAKLALDDKAKNNIPHDETGDIDCSKIKFDPGFTPPPLDINKRLEQLRGCLDPNDPWYQPEYQHINIRAVIKLYEEGKIDGTQQVYIQDGKIVSREERENVPLPSMVEGMFHQYAEKVSYGHGPFGNNFHEIRMLVRLIPALGGDGTTHGIITMNDTGSDMLTLYTSDLMHLGNYNLYSGWQAPVSLTDANGTSRYFQKISVQVLLVGNGDVPWRSNWIWEDAIVRQDHVQRLSGAGIRRHFYFGTTPGNHYLAVATTKGGLSSLL